MTKSLVSSTSMDFDGLFAGDVMPVVTDSVKLKSGASYLRGTVLGIVTASGLAVAVDSSKSDGSQTPYAVLASDTDATAAASPAPAYMTGEFNSAKLIFGGTDTVATHKNALRSLGIYAKTVQG